MSHFSADYIKALGAHDVELGILGVKATYLIELKIA